MLMNYTIIIIIKSFVSGSDGNKNQIDAIAPFNIWNSAIETVITICVLTVDRGEMSFTNKFYCVFSSHSKNHLLRGIRTLRVCDFFVFFLFFFKSEESSTFYTTSRHPFCSIDSKRVQPVYTHRHTMCLFWLYIRNNNNHTAQSARSGYVSIIFFFFFSLRFALHFFLFVCVTLAMWPYCERVYMNAMRRTLPLRLYVW